MIGSKWKPRNLKVRTPTGTIIISLNRNIRIRSRKVVGATSRMTIFTEASIKRKTSIAFTRISIRKNRLKMKKSKENMMIKVVSIGLTKKISKQMVVRKDDQIQLISKIFMSIQVTIRLMVLRLTENQGTGMIGALKHLIITRNGVTKPKVQKLWKTSTRESMQNG